MTNCQLLSTQGYIPWAVVISLLLAYITSLSKISLCPRFLKPSLKTEARGSSIRHLGDARTNWLSSLVVRKWVPHNRKSTTIKSAIVTLGSQGGCIVRSHVSWRGERNISYRVWKPLSSIRVLKPRGKPIMESQKSTLSASGGLELLQI